MRYNRLPSEIARIPSYLEYEAFCFDEACYYIITETEKGTKFRFSEDKVKKDGTKLTFLDKALKEVR